MLFLSILSGGITRAQVYSGGITGSVLDPSGLSVAGARIEVDSASGVHLSATTDKVGFFSISLPEQATYRVRAEAAGFAPAVRNVQLAGPTTTLGLRLLKLSATSEEIVVAANVSRYTLFRGFHIFRSGIVRGKGVRSAAMYLKIGK